MRNSVIRSLFCLPLVILGCDATPAERARHTEIVRQSNASQAVAALSEVVYVRDDRAKPPVCFGYFWRGAGNGGPAAFTVPCESVEHLLANK